VVRQAAGEGRCAVSDRTRFTAGSHKLTRQDFDRLADLSGHEWLLGGSWEALEPEALAIAVTNFFDLSEAAAGSERHLRWLRAIKVLSDNAAYIENGFAHGAD
jgi:hypothetical protein